MERAFFGSFDHALSAQRIIRGLEHKNGEPLRTPRRGVWVFFWSSLESELKSELEPTHLQTGSEACDATAVAAVDAAIRGRQADVVKHVIGLELEFCLYPLSNEEGLEETQVSVKVLRPVELADTGVSEGVESGRLGPRPGRLAKRIQRDSIGRLEPVSGCIRIARPRAVLNATYDVWQARTLVDGSRT